MVTIAVFVGSLRRSSVNLRLARELEALLPDGVAFRFADLDLPLYNFDLEADYPPAARALKDLVENADGVLFVTPEYNRSFPGVLKNAIDWASRPSKHNSFNGKPVAIAGASGALGTTQAQVHLRNVLLYLNTRLMGQPEMYVDVQRVHNEEGALTDEATTFFQSFVSALVSHVSPAQ